MGAASEGDIDKYMHITGRMSKWLRELEESGEIIEISIDGLQKKYYILKEDLAGIGETPKEWSITRCNLLSPFDNLIILRNRIKEIFDFDYTLECYTPG